MRIMLAMIVHHEDIAMASDAIQSVEHLVDSIRIVVDGEPREPAGFGAEKSLAFEIRVAGPRDFARLRNEAMELCRYDDAEAIVTIDADQRFEGPLTREELEQGLSMSDAVGILEKHPRADLNGPHRPFAWLANVGIQWVYPVHEILNTDPLLVLGAEAGYLDSRSTRSHRSMNRKEETRKDMLVMRKFLNSHPGDEHMRKKLLESQSLLLELRDDVVVTEAEE